jgi:hypothetical protein
MLKFGSISRLVNLIFRKDSQLITVRPNQTTTYTAARDVQLPEADSDQVVVSRTSSDVNGSRLQNKHLSNDNVKFVDATDNSKSIAHNSASAVASKELTLASAITDDRTVTFPDATGTLALNPMTTAGDVIYGGVSGVPTRLGVGSTGDVLTVAAGVPSWSAPAASGSGSGELNVISNPSASTAITGWTASGAGITVARSTTSSDLPLEGIIASAIKITPVSSTDYVYFRWTMPAALKNTKLKLQWDQRPLSGYASGDLKVEVHTNTASNYAGTDATLPLSTDSSSVSAIPNQTGIYTTTYDSDSSDYYEVRIIRVAGTTALNITNVISGPGIQPQGSVVGPTLDVSSSITYSAGFGATTNNTWHYERVGSWMHLHGYFTAGTVAGSVGSLILPPGFSIDYAAIGSTTNTPMLGTWITNNASGGNVLFYTGNLAGVWFADGSTTDRVFFAGANSGVSGQFNKNNPNSFMQSGGALVSDLWIPIAEWAGSGTVNLAQNDVEYAYNSSVSDTTDTSSFGYGPGGTQFGNFSTTRTKRVRFQTPIQPTDRIRLEITSDSGATWFDMDNTTVISQYFIQGVGATEYGWHVLPVNSTDIDVRFQLYRRPTSAIYGGAGDDYSAIDNDPVYKWRVVKSKSGQAIGFGTVSQNSAGLMPASNTNLDNAAATRLGFKTYSHGGSYASGLAPTVTYSAGGGSLSSVQQGDFVPYQMNDGSWRMRFNIDAVLSATSRSSITLAIAGVTFKTVGSGAGQQIAASRYSANQGTNYALANPGAGTVFASYNAANTDTEVGFAGDVALASKPTWAY